MTYSNLLIYLMCYCVSLYYEGSLCNVILVKRAGCYEVVFCLFTIHKIYMKINIAHLIYIVL